MAALPSSACSSCMGASGLLGPSLGLGLELGLLKLLGLVFAALTLWLLSRGLGLERQVPLFPGVASYIATDLNTMLGGCNYSSGSIK